MSTPSLFAWAIAFYREGMRSGILIGFLLGVLTIALLAPGEPLYALIAAVAGGTLGSTAIVLRLIRRERSKSRESDRGLDGG